MKLAKKRLVPKPFTYSSMINGVRKVKIFWGQKPPLVNFTAEGIQFHCKKRGQVPFNSINNIADILIWSRKLSDHELSMLEGI
jgi:hypothetical protein